MKEITMYICEFCNTLHTTKEDAERCVRKHIKIRKICHAKYDPFFDRSTKYPTSIDVEMEDGEVITYRHFDRKDNT